jgi:hypothetical protein
VRSKPEPLLCELHAHTRWSSLTLSVRELVDLHGRLGYDVLCITDHALRDDQAAEESAHVGASRFDGYLKEVMRTSRGWSDAPSWPPDGPRVTTSTPALYPRKGGIVRP